MLVVKQERAYGSATAMEGDAENMFAMEQILKDHSYVVSRETECVEVIVVSDDDEEDEGYESLRDTKESDVEYLHKAAYDAGCKEHVFRSVCSADEDSSSGNCYAGYVREQSDMKTVDSTNVFIDGEKYLTCSDSGSLGPSACVKSTSLDTGSITESNTNTRQNHVGGGVDLSANANPYTLNPSLGYSNTPEPSGGQQSFQQPPVAPTLPVFGAWGSGQSNVNVFQSVPSPSVASVNDRPYPVLLQTAGGAVVYSAPNACLVNNYEPFPVSLGIGSAPQPMVMLNGQFSNQAPAPVLLLRHQPGGAPLQLLSPITVFGRSSSQIFQPVRVERHCSAQILPHGVYNYERSSLHCTKSCQKTKPEKKRIKKNCENGSAKKKPRRGCKVLKGIENILAQADEMLGGVSEPKKPRKRGGQPKKATACKSGTGSASSGTVASEKEQTQKSKRTSKSDASGKSRKEPEREGDSQTITSFFPVRRRDRRMTSRELKKVREQEIEEKIKAGCDEGLEVVEIEGKGRGVVATKDFERDDFVVEYAGELVNITTAKQREDLYEKDEQVGCYMYYFIHKNKQYCIDATAESGKLGRLLNHSRRGNCHTKVVAVGDRPYLILLASQHIEKGEELTYDYGDRSQSAIESHPWLKL